MNKTHLDYFRDRSEREHPWTGNKLRDWWTSVFGDQPTRLQPSTVSRDKLKSICANSDYSNREALAAVMAWGGMRRSHGRGLIVNLEKICDIVGNLRCGQLSRDGAYSQFFELRRNGQLRGMGPAYYTKLIFFCSPKHDGFIMDQWTSKSINLIYDTRVVDLTYAGHVSDKNDATTYVKFCHAVEELAQKGGWTTEEAEMRLFSYGGKTKGLWREYVIKNWKRPGKQL